MASLEISFWATSFILVKNNMNTGKVWIDKAGNWKMAKDTPHVDSLEFEESLHYLEGITLCFEHINQLANEMQVVGDFLNERTHLVLLQNQSIIADDYVKVIQRWLSLPRWRNWRVILKFGRKNEDTLVVYSNAVVARPE